MNPGPTEVQRIRTQLRVSILSYLDRSENEMDFCGRCHLPLPSGEFEEYEFCPWCDVSFNGDAPRGDESRRIIEHQWEVQDEIQCGECGGEYEQPNRYPFCFCPHCGARFAFGDKLIVELPFVVR